MIGGGVAPGRAGPQHPGKRLGGVVAPGTQRVQAEPLEIRLGAFLVRMTGHHAGIQPDPGHALQHLVRDPDTGKGAVPGGGRGPGPAPRRVHRGADPAQRPLPATGDLSQRAPRRGHRGDQPEQTFLIAYHPEVADHLGAVGDRAGQVRHHPPPVMNQQPVRGQRPGQPSGQAHVVRQRPDQRHPGMRHDPGAIRGDSQALQPASSVHLSSAPRSGPD